MDQETNEVSRPRRQIPWRDWLKKCIQVLTLVASYAGRGMAGGFRALGRLLACAGGAAYNKLLRPLTTLPERTRTLVRDKRGNRFPESEYGVVRLLLFVWGSLPRLGSLLRERLLRRRKRSAHGSGRVRNWMERLRVHPAIFLGGAMAVAMVAVAISLYTVGTAVAYDGADLGVAAGRRTVDQVVSAVEETTRRTMDDESYEIDRSLLSSRHTLVARREVESREALQEKLVDRLGVIDYGYVLYVDEEPIAATAFSGALEELLEQMKIGYVTENTVTCDFAEEVEIREQYVDRSYMMNLGYIAERVNEIRAEEITHTVTQDDTLESIAEAYNLSVSQLLHMNTGYDASSLREGDVLTVAQAVPYLTVVDVERQTYVQDVPYEIAYQEDPEMYQGDYEVLSAGEYGKADVTANVTYVNGEETGRQVVASVTLRQPVTELQLQGTLERPNWLPTGVFRWPCSGVITSYFGYRRPSVAGASTYHTALDIASGYGTPIYASDGGTVITAGWSGGTGYTVKIDHGNGYVTLYGHNSSLLVNVGDHVYQGQQIARMGSTGISSGVHCHFSIIENGTYVDPLNYLESR